MKNIILVFVFTLSTGLSNSFAQSTLQHKQFHFSEKLSGKLEDMTGFRLVSLNTDHSTCDFYTRIATVFRDSLGITKSPVVCRGVGGLKTIKRIRKKLGSEVCLKMNYAGFIEGGDRYLIFYYQIYGDSLNECINDFLILSTEDGQLVVDDIPPYSSNRDIFVLRVINPDSIPLMIGLDTFSIRHSQDTMRTLSLDKVNNNGAFKFSSLFKCEGWGGYDTGTNFELSVNFTSKDSKFERDYFYNDTLKFSPYSRRYMVSRDYLSEFNSLKKLLGGFMLAYTSQHLPMLYVNPSDAPILERSKYKERANGQFYLINYFVPLYQTRLKNSYGLNLSAIVFDVVLDGVNTGARALVAVEKSDGTFLIFTQFDEYEYLESEIWFELSMKMENIQKVFNSPFSKMEGPVDQEL